MSKQSLVLKLKKNLIQIVDVHHDIILKNIKCDDPEFFPLIEDAVRTGKVTFDYLLNNAVSSVNDIEIDITLKDLDGTQKETVNGFEIGDKLYVKGYGSRLFILQLFDDVSGDDIAIINDYHTGEEKLVRNSELIPISGSSHFSRTMSPPADNEANKTTKPLIPLQRHQAVFIKGHGLKVYAFESYDDASGDVLAVLFNKDDGQYNAHQDEILVSLEGDDANLPESEEHTGGSSSYYMTYVENPTTLDTPYRAECNDIIEALELTFAEANILKAIWRTAAERQGKKKKGNDAYYDAEKVIFFGKRMLVKADTELPF